MSCPPSIRPRPVGFLTRLRRDRRGVSAVEFALLAPVMITFYFGLAEFCQGYMAQKRMGHSAAMVADLVSQTDVVKTDELDDIFAVGALIMKPFPATTLKLRVSSVTRDPNGVAKVDWSRGSGLAAHSPGATVTVPVGMIDNGESLIMSEATYDYASPVKFILPAVTQFKNNFYLRPRRVEKVGCADC